MKKLTPYYIKLIKNNIDFYFNASTKKEQQDGKQWYIKAQNFVEETALNYAYSFDVVAGVLSALSPRNKWEQNKKDCITVLNAVNNGISPEDVKVCTFHKNKFKAFGIAKGNVKITEDSQKTYSFINNIAYLDNKYVTIDIWALRACFNKTISIKSATIGKTAYKQITNIFLEKSQEYDIKGFELQAILWLTAQRLYSYD